MSYAYEGDVPEGAPQAPAAETRRYGAGVTRKLPAMMSGHVLFGGWGTASGVTVENNSFIMPDSDVIVGRSILLAPHEAATRAEIATMLTRFCALYGTAGLPI